MSRENVELVLKVQSADLLHAFRDDELWEARLANYASDFEHVAVNQVEPPTMQVGLEHFRTAWLNWLEPWDSYRQEIDNAIDCGDRVLLLVTHYGRMKASSAEVKLTGASLWTVREGKIVRMESHTDRSEALRAVGLDE